MPMDDAIKELAERVAALELWMDALTQQGKFAPGTDCQHKVCSYHTHYFRNYNPVRCGEKLDHATFHAAEGCCEAVQRQITDWMNAHPNQPIPEHLSKRVDYWEARSAF